MATRSLGRVAIILDVVGDAEGKIIRVEGSLKNLEKTARRASRRTASGVAAVGMETSRATAGITSFATSFKFGVGLLIGGMFLQIANNARQTTLAIVELGVQTLKTFGMIGANILGVAKDFELAEAQLRFAFGDRAQEVMEKALDTATRTSFLTREVLNITATLGRFGIDPFAESAQVKTKSGAIINGLEAINDAAAATGKQMFQVRLALQNFISEKTFKAAVRSPRRRLDLPLEVVEKLKDGFKEAQTAQERFNIFVKALGGTFGGMGRSISGTLDFVMKNLVDFKELLFDTIGRPAVAVFTPLLLKFQEWLKVLRDNEKQVASFSKVFKELSEQVVKVASALFMVVRFVTRLAQENPKLTKRIIQFTAALSVLAIVLGGVLTIMISFALAVVAVLVVITTLIAGIALFVVGLVAFQLMIPTIILLTSVLVLVGVAVDDLGKSFGITFESITLVLKRTFFTVKALFELINTSIGDQGSISEASFNKLKELGIVQFVADLFGAWFRLKEAVVAAWGVIRPVLVEFGILGEKLTKKTDKLGVVTSGSFLNMINSMSPEKWREIGTVVGIVVGKMITDFAKLTAEVMKLASSIDVFITALNFALKNPLVAGGLLLAGGTGALTQASQIASEREKLALEKPEITPLGGGRITHRPSARAAQEPAVVVAREAVNQSFVGQREQEGFADDPVQMMTRPIIINLDGRKMAEVLFQETNRSRMRLGQEGL